MKKMNSHLKSALYWVLGASFLSFLGGILIALYSHKNDLDDEEVRKELKKECIIIAAFFIALTLLSCTNTFFVSVLQISRWGRLTKTMTFYDVWSIAYSVINGLIIIARSVIVVVSVIKHYSLSKTDSSKPAVVENQPVEEEAK